MVKSEMRVLVLLLAVVCPALGSTKKPATGCNFWGREKVENGSLWLRPSGCSWDPWARSNATVAQILVNGRVYQRVNGAYVPYAESYFQTVEYPGEMAVLYDPNNLYTNWTCAGWNCRPVSVFRNGSGYRCDDETEFGDCVAWNAKPDYYVPLCHNSSSLKCTIWVPMGSLTGGSDLAATQVVLTLSGLVYIVGVCCLAVNPDVAQRGIDTVMMTTMWVWTFILSEISMVVMGRFEEWVGRMQVDLDYVTYQTCVRQCALIAEKDANMAAWNQCADIGVPCRGAGLVGMVAPCRGCKDEAGDWHHMVEYALWMKLAVFYYWCLLVIYALFMHWRVTNKRWLVGSWFAAMVELVVGWGVFLTRVTVETMAEYSSPFEGQNALMQVGWAWFGLSLAWLVVFWLGKFVALVQEKEQGVVGARSELVVMSSD